MAEYKDLTAILSLAKDLVGKMPTSFYNGIQALLQGIINLPSADVAPVRHGRWDNSKASFGEMCSECKFIVWWDDDGPHKFNYCPNCGAVMDGKGTVEVDNGR